MRKFFLIITVLTLFGSLAPVGFNFSQKPNLEIKTVHAAQNGGFLFRKQITYDTSANGAAISSNQPNFPIAVHINSSSWPTVTERQHFFGSSTSDYNPGGKRIRFYDSDGSTNLPYEVEYFNRGSDDQTATPGEAVYWVKIPTVYQSGDANYATHRFIWAAYGNDPDGTDYHDYGSYVLQQQAVWDDGGNNYFKMVQHMKDGVDTSHISDSTSNATDGAKKGGNEPVQATGQVEYGQSFDGSNDYITFWHPASLNVGTNNLTISFWTKLPSSQTYWSFMNKDTNGTKFYVTLGGTNRRNINVANLVGVALLSTELTTDVWYHVTLKRDGTYAYIFLNGTQDQKSTSSSNVAFTDSNDLYLAIDSLLQNPGKYNIDELHWSLTDRSADWIKLEYYSMKKTNYNGDNGAGSGKFITFGSELSRGATSASIFHTSDTDFNIGTYVGSPPQTAWNNVTGTGASVGLAINSPAYSLTQTNDNSPYDDTTTPKPTYLTGSFKNRGNSPFTATGMSNTTTTGSGAGTSVGLTQDTSWISGYCGILVKNADVSGTNQWKTTNDACVGPQCATNLDTSYPANYALIFSNSSDIFSAYPARNACKTLGGRLPTITELSCIYTNKANFGSFQSNYYWSSTEFNAGVARYFNFTNGIYSLETKTNYWYVRCVSNTPIYNSSGTYTSYVDSGNVLSQIWNTFQMTKGSTAGGAGTIAIKVKASTSNSTPPTFDATGAACDFSVSTDGSSGSKDLTTCTNLGSGRYLWYQATLTTADTANSPLLQDVTVGVTNGSYYSSGSYTSLPIQRAQVASWGNLTYSAPNLNGQGLGIKVRTCASSDSGVCDGYHSWGSCTAITSGNALSTGGCVSNNDKFIQYQANFTSDTTNTAYLDDITLDYFYNPDTSIISGVVKFFGSIIFK